MTQPPQRPIIRRISNAQFQPKRRSSSAVIRNRTRIFTPSGGGDFTLEELGRIIPPRNARGFKIVRPMGGRYIRNDNPQGLGTEGPFTMDQWPTEEDDLSAFEGLEITRVIFDVGE